MKHYPLFLVVAAATVLGPGPGVVMSLTNALRYGLRGTFGGILGIAFGALIVAAVSATSVGIVLATSSLAFNTLKGVGAAYLLYLGVRLWRAPPFRFTDQIAHAARFNTRFLEGLSLQLTNPKAIFFFLSVFPQFIDPAAGYAAQFTMLVLTYSGLVVVIHCGYALFAKRAQRWLTSARGGAVVNRTASVAFMLFGGALAMAQR
jgi:threonine/homoserine/homoserine lactone efflux protein